MNLNQVARSLYLWSAIGFGTAGMYIPAMGLHFATLPFDKRRRFGHWYASRWGRFILRLNNRWTSQVYGQERVPRDKPMVVIANHQGMGDIMMAFCLDLHFKWISKRANFMVPFMGWWMFHAGYIPLKRGDKESVKQCMDKAKWWLDQGVSVLFFPEGTRSHDGHVKPFKRGAFQLAIEAGVDILPLAITGTHDALPKGTWRFNDELSHMRLLVGETISTRGLTVDDVEAFAESCRQEVVLLKHRLDRIVRGEPEHLPLRAVG